MLVRMQYLSRPVGPQTTGITVGRLLSARRNGLVASGHPVKTVVA